MDLKRGLLVKKILLTIVLFLILVNIGFGDIAKNLGGLAAIIVGLIFTQLFYNLFRRLSYNKYKDF